jgi:protein N-lysine methyltransferase METTL21A
MEDEKHHKPDEEQSVFLNFNEDLVQLPTIKASGTSEIDFDGLLTTPLKLHEDLKEGCGGQLWPAGMVLAKYMLRKHRHSLKDQNMSVCFRHVKSNRITDIRSLALS